MKDFYQRLIEHVSKKSKLWRGSVMTLAAIVVFTTTYALILPAITLDVAEAGEDPAIEVAADFDSDGQAQTETTVSHIEEDQTPAPADSQSAQTDPSTEGAGDFDEEVTADAQEPSSVTLASSPIVSADGDVTLTFDESAAIPEGTVLTVTDLTADEAEPYLAAAREKAEAGVPGTIIEDSLFHQLQLTCDGETVIPAAPVDITIDYSQDALRTTDAAPYAVVCSDTVSSYNTILFTKNADDTPVFDLTGDAVTTVTLAQYSFDRYGDTFGIVTVKAPAADSTETEEVFADNEEVNRIEATETQPTDADSETETDQTPAADNGQNDPVVANDEVGEFAETTDIVTENDSQVQNPVSEDAEHTVNNEDVQDAEGTDANTAEPASDDFDKTDEEANDTTAYQYTFTGGTSVLLSDLAEETGISAADAAVPFSIENVANVSFSNEDYFTAIKQADGDWLLTSVALSKDAQTLTIEMQDTTVYEVQVTVSGKEELDLTIATIRPAANGEILPEEAIGHAAILTGDDAETAKQAVIGFEKSKIISKPNKVKSVRSRNTLSAASTTAADDFSVTEETSSTTDTTQSAGLAYQVFDISLDNVNAKEYDEGFQVEVTLPETEKIVGKDFHLYHIHDGVEEITDFDIDAINIAGTDLQKVNGFSFQTDNFSQFVLSYTVDFEYTDEDGMRYAWSWPGEGSYKISDIMAEIGIEGEISDVSLVRRIDEGGSEKVLYLSEDGTQLTSESMFLDTFELSVTVDNVIYKLTITDAITSKDLSNFVTSVNINASQSAENPDEYTVRAGKEVQIDISFAENSRLQFDMDSMYYVIPDGMEVEDGTTGTITINATDDEGNSYAIDGNVFNVQDGVLTVTWNKEHPSFQHLASAANTEFTIHIKASFTEERKAVNFGSGYQRTVNVDNSKTVTVNKTASGINKETGEVMYKLIVTSTGDTENIVVTDTFSGKAVSYVQNSVSIYSNKDWMDPQTLVSGWSYNSQSDSGFSLTIPSMTDGQTYAITYTGRVDLSNLTRNEDGSYGIESDTHNGVTTRPGDGDEDSDSHSFNNVITAPTVNKGATNVTDNENGTRTIDWKIEASSINGHNSQDSLAGGTIKDAIDRTTKVDGEKTSADIMKYTGDGPTLVITDENGVVLDTRQLSWAQVGVNNLDTDKNWTYRVPVSDNNSQTAVGSATGKLTYTITYSTEVDMRGIHENVNVKNGSEAGGKSSSGSAGVTPNGDETYGVDKRMVSDKGKESVTWLKDGTEVTTEVPVIEWEVTLTVPSSGLTEAVVTDVYPHIDNSTYRDSYKDGSLIVSGLTNGTVNGKNVVESYTVDTNSDTTKAVITFNYTENGTSKTGLYGTGEQRKVTVRLKTVCDPEWIEGARGQGAADWRQEHKNTVTFNVYTDTASAYPMVEQKAKKGATSEYQAGTMMVDGVELPYWEYYIDLDGLSGGMVVTDTFDERLEYVPLTYTGNDWAKNGLLQGGNPNWRTASAVGDDNNNSGDKFARWVDATVSGNTVSFSIETNNIPELYNNNGTIESTTAYRLYYVLRVKDSKALTSLQKESAEASNGYTTLHNIATFGDSTTEHDVKYQYKPINKSMLNESEVGGTNNVGKFQIVVNPNGYDMDPTSSFLTVTDTLVKNLAIDYNTIVVSPSEGARWNVSGDVVTFTVPDETPVTITYDALIIGTGSVDIQNDVSVKGISDSYKSQKQVTARGEGTASTVSIKVKKHKYGDLTTTLEGAVFQLFKYDSNLTDGLSDNTQYVYGENVPVLSQLNNANWVPVTDKDGQIITRTTNAEGIATFLGHESDEGWTIYENELYALKEIQVPEGYTKDNVDYWVFVVAHDGIAHYSDYIYRTGDSMRIANYPKGGILIHKNVLGIELTEEQKQAIVFKIYKDDVLVDTLTYDAFTQGAYHVEPESGNEDSFKGTYKIVEEAVAPDGYLLVPGVLSTWTATENGSEVTMTSEGTVTKDSADESKIITTATITVTDINKEYTVDFLNRYTSAKVTVVKVGESNEPLAGAEFALIGTLTDGTTVELTGESTNTTAGFSFTGLADGEYTLTEIKAPEGYVRLVNPMTFKVVDGEVAWDGETEKSGAVVYNYATNTATIKNERDFKIVARKVWAGDDEKVDPVTVKLYRTNQEVSLKTVLVRNHNESFGNITGIIGSTITATYEDGNGDKKTFTAVLDNNLQQFHITENVTNNLSVVVTLPENVQKSAKLVDTKQTENNLAEFDELTRMDPLGNMYTYWVEEVKPEGRYIVSYENNYINYLSADMTTVITNEPEDSFDIHVTKQWKTEDGSDDDTTTTPVEMTLYRMANTPKQVTFKLFTDYNLSLQGTYTVFAGSTIMVEYDYPGDNAPSHGDVANIAEDTSVAHHVKYTFNVDDCSKGGDGAYYFQITAGSEASSNHAISIAPPALILNGREAVGKLYTSDNRATFAGLYEKDEAGDVYVYWVEETVPSGYTVSYTSQYGNKDSNELVVVNTPKTYNDGEIEVRKIWKDENGAVIDDTIDLPSVTLKLSAKADETPATIYAGSEYNPDTIFTSADKDKDNRDIHIGDVVTVTVSNQKSAWYSIDYVKQGNAATGTKGEMTKSYDGKSVTFTVTNTKMYILMNANTDTYSISVAKADSSSSGSSVPSSINVTLNSQNNWYWNNKASNVTLDTSGYAWCIEEVSGLEGYTVSYSDNNTNGITSGALTATNQKIAMGSLKVKKNITVNGDALASTNQKLANGSYTFVVKRYGSDEVLHTVVITYTNGTVTATLDGSNVIADKDGYVIVPNLMPGDYTVTETVITDSDAVFASAARGDNDDSVVDTANKTVTVHVTGNDKTAALTNALAIFTNDVETEKFYIEKRFSRDGADIHNWYKDYGKSGMPYYAIQTIYFHLYRTVDGETYFVDEYGQRSNKLHTLTYSDTIEAPFSFKENNTQENNDFTEGETLHFAKVLENLPKGTYTYKECNSAGVEWDGDQNNDYYMICQESKDGVTLNLMKNYFTTAVAVKHWWDYDNTVTHPDVTFRLEKKVGENNWTSVDTLTLSEKNTGTGYQYNAAKTTCVDGTTPDYPYVQWNYLPTWDFDAWAAIQYRVVEVGATNIVGYTPEVDNNAEQTLTDGNLLGKAYARDVNTVFNNKLTTTNLYVKKDWKVGDQTIDKASLPDWLPAEVPYILHRVQYSDEGRTQLIANSDETVEVPQAKSKLLKSDKYANVIVDDLPTVKVNYDASRNPKFYLTYYGYYVEETVPGGFTVKYKVDGEETEKSTANTAVVTDYSSGHNGILMINTEDTTSISVTKAWMINGAIVDDSGEEIDKITFKLWRINGTNNVRIGIADDHPVVDEDAADQLFEIKKTDGKWQATTISNLWKHSAESGSSEYKYYVEEVAAYKGTTQVTGWIPKYRSAATGEVTGDYIAAETANSVAISGGTIEITNTKSTIALPATGGSGTTGVYAIGITLMSMAGLGLLLSRRRYRGEGI